MFEICEGLPCSNPPIDAAVLLSRPWDGDDGGQVDARYFDPVQEEVKRFHPHQSRRGDAASGAGVHASMGPELGQVGVKLYVFFNYRLASRICNYCLQLQAKVCKLVLLYFTVSDIKGLCIKGIKFINDVRKTISKKTHHNLVLTTTA